MLITDVCELLIGGCYDFC